MYFEIAPLLPFLPPFCPSERGFEGKMACSSPFNEENQNCPPPALFLFKTAPLLPFFLSKTAPLLPFFVILTKTYPLLRVEGVEITWRNAE